MNPLLIATPLAAAVAGFTYATVAPTSCFWGHVVSRGPRDTRRIALTFDDGPTAGATDRVLDTLRHHGVRATFFVIGRNVERSPELVQRMHDEGHQVANHTYSHSHYASLGRGRYWRDEIHRTDEAIQRIIGVRPVIFRPPVGVKTWHTLGQARRLGHTTVTWSRRAWDGLSTSPEKILSRLTHLTAGDIVLLHDGIQPHRTTRDPTPTLEALPRLLESIHRRQLAPVRIDELLGIPAYAEPRGD
jgi:peptidoglycan/xylan/chitin deacetylase (PgdA/CDA1 family)